MRSSQGPLVGDAGNMPRALRVRERRPTARIRPVEGFARGKSSMAAGEARHCARSPQSPGGLIALLGLRAVARRPSAIARRRALRASARLRLARRAQSSYGYPARRLVRQGTGDWAAPPVTAGAAHSRSPRPARCLDTIARLVAWGKTLDRYRVGTVDRQRAPRSLQRFSGGVSRAAGAVRRARLGVPTAAGRE